MKIDRIEVQVVYGSANKRVSLDTQKTVPPTGGLLLRFHTDSCVSIGFAPLNRYVSAEVLMPYLQRMAAQLLNQYRSAPQPEEFWYRTQREFALESGIAFRHAQAAFDLALWDLKAKQYQTNLREVLGFPTQSFTWHSWNAGRSDLSQAELLPGCVKITEVGCKGVLAGFPIYGDVGENASRMHCIRDSIGEDNWLGIAADSPMPLSQALGVALFLEDDVGPDWFEDFVPIHDRKGQELLAQRLEIPLAAGHMLTKVADYLPLLQDGYVRILRANPYHLGGITPLLQLQSIARLYPVELSIRQAPEIATLFPQPTIEVDDWLQLALRESNYTLQGAQLVPTTTSGHGLSHDFTAAKNWQTLGSSGV